VAAEIIYLICSCGKAVPTGLFIDPTDLLTARDNFKNKVTKCHYCGDSLVWGDARFVSEDYVKETGRL
jgi:hypothetical protein